MEENQIKKPPTPLGDQYSFIIGIKSLEL